MMPRRPVMGRRGYDLPTGNVTRSSGRASRSGVLRLTQKGHGVPSEAPIGAQIEPRHDLLESVAHPFSSPLVAAEQERTGTHGVAST